MSQSPVAELPESISDYFQATAEVARGVFDRHEKHALDEQAGPAYLEGFALSRWIFWRRLRKVTSLFPSGELENVVDFGCGFGLLLPWLHQRSQKVFGVDMMPELASQFLNDWGKEHEFDSSRVSIFDSLDATGLSNQSVDVILALDVLEHVDDLEKLVGRMAELLKPNGVLIVSGPTENWWYRLGRRIVGFSGDYHVRNIDDIQYVMESKMSVDVVSRVFYPLTLFNILQATPNAN